MLVSLKTSFGLAVAALSMTVAQVEAGVHILSLEFMQAMFSSTINALIFVNLGVTLMFEVFRKFVTVFLNGLSVDEQKELRNTLLNFAMFKLVVVATVLRPDWIDLLVWFVWYCIIGFVKMLSILARSRFQRIALNPSTPLAARKRVLMLTWVVLAADVMWALICIALFIDAGLSVLCLLLFDCVIIFVNAVYTLVKYSIHVRDLREQGNWQGRPDLEFYSEMVADVLNLLATIAHYLHIWFLNGITLSLTDAILVKSLVGVVNKLRAKVQVYTNYLKLARETEERFPCASQEQLDAAGDACPICLQALAPARVLPCGHVFHLMCLRQWLQRLEANHTCPVCRASVADGSPAPTTPTAGAAGAGAGAAAADAAPQTPIVNLTPLGFDQESVFRLNLAQWASWLPRFSMEVINRRQRTVSPEVMAQGVAQVLDVFPHLSPNAIREDLRRNGGAVQATIERALQGHIMAAADDATLQAAPEAAPAAAAGTTQPTAATVAAAATQAQAQPAATTQAQVQPTAQAVEQPTAQAPEQPTARPHGAPGTAAQQVATPVSGAGAGAGAGEGDSSSPFNSEPVDIGPDDELRADLARLRKRDYFGILKARKRHLYRTGRRLWEQKYGAQE